MNRDQYVEKLKADLDRWNAQAGEWEAKARVAQTEMRAVYEQQLGALRHQREQAAQSLAEMQTASAAAWQDMARGADQAWQQLREAFERARAEFERHQP